MHGHDGLARSPNKKTIANILGGGGITYRNQPTVPSTHGVHEQTP